MEGAAAPRPALSFSPRRRNDPFVRDHFPFTALLSPGTTTTTTTTTSTSRAPTAEKATSVAARVAVTLGECLAGEGGESLPLAPRARRGRGHRRGGSGSANPPLADAVFFSSPRRGRGVFGTRSPGGSSSPPPPPATTCQVEKQPATATRARTQHGTAADADPFIAHSSSNFHVDLRG